jgi:hypothetical protein
MLLSDYIDMKKEPTMDAPTPANDNPVFESFPEYHNFPSQWDLSELDTPARPARNEPGEYSTRFSASQNALSETSVPLGEASPVFSRDPFPKLRTFPVYWDLSR